MNPRAFLPAALLVLGIEDVDEVAIRNELLRCRVQKDLKTSPPGTDRCPIADWTLRPRRGEIRRERENLHAAQPNNLRVFAARFLAEKTHFALRFDGAEALLYAYTVPIPLFYMEPHMRPSTNCGFPGCANTRSMDAHHIDHWANGGETRPSNLVLLCRFHHRAVHEGGIGIERLDDGALRFVRPNVVLVDSGFEEISKLMAYSIINLR